MEQPPYARIVAEIRRRVADGELKVGDRVPSTRQITQEWGVAMATATKVLTTLRQEGTVRAVPGVGTVVQSSLARAPRDVRPAEPVLSRDRVVRAAVELADAEGLALLSMRRIATELGVSTMSLYRHVSGKDELVMAMADAVFTEDGLPDDAPEDWRTRLELAARLQWAIYHRHPWLPQVISMTRPQLMPNAMAHTEWSLRAVDGRDLDLTTMLHVAVTMFAFVRGLAVSLEVELQAQQDTGMDVDEWMQRQDTAFYRVVASGKYPVLARMAAGDDIDFTLETLFEFGLRRMLDGFAVLLD